jgi:hypothetical protein
MGQATVDLPDPLDAPPPSSLSGTDDLLAQLAGDEIDRLLAEADLEQKSSATTPKAPADPAPADSTDPTPSSESTVVAPASATGVVAVAESTVASADAATAASGADDDELDTLLSKLDEDGSKFIASTAQVETSAIAAAAADDEIKSLVDRVPEVLAQFPAPAGAADPAPDAVDEVMSAAERDALKIGELADAAAPAADATEDEGPGRLTPLIKLLEALNAPLSFVPDALRDTLGKVAIITLVNAIAVLIYVLFLRH